MNGKIIGLLRILLGAFFMASGIGKLLDVQSFIETAHQYGFPAPIAIFSIFIPPIEVLLGLGLWLNLFAKRLALFALVLLCAFSVALAFGMWKGALQSCGCFGAFSFLELPLWAVWVRNGVLIGIAYLIWKYAEPDLSPRHTLKWSVAIILGAIAFTTSGASSLSPLWQGETSTNKEFVGKSVQELPIKAYLNTSPDSTYLLYAFSPTCPHCLDATENLKAWQRSGKIARVIALTATSDSLLQSYIRIMQPNFAISQVPLETFRAFAPFVPQAYLIRGNKLIFKLPSPLPSPYRLRLD